MCIDVRFLTRQEIEIIPVVHMASNRNLDENFQACSEKKNRSEATRSGEAKWDNLGNRDAWRAGLDVPDAAFGAKYDLRAYHSREGKDMVGTVDAIGRRGDRMSIRGG